MSDVPRARDILEKLIDSCDDVVFMKRIIRRDVIPLLDREKPTFKTKRKLPPMTREQAVLCIEYRDRGLPMNEIARKLGTNIGRVSEVINGLREGI